MGQSKNELRRFKVQGLRPVGDRGPISLENAEELMKLAAERMAKKTGALISGKVLCTEKQIAGDHVVPELSLVATIVALSR